MPGSASREPTRAPAIPADRRQNLATAAPLSMSRAAASRRALSSSFSSGWKPLLIEHRQHMSDTSASVGIRQQTSADVSVGLEQRLEALAERARPKLVVRSPRNPQISGTKVLENLVSRGGSGRAAYVSIRQHTSAYVSIRQHTSAYNLLSRGGRGRAQLLPS